MADAGRHLLAAAAETVFMTTISKQGCTGIQKAYLATEQSAQGSVVEGCKSKDGTKPATPQLVRAWAFELANDGTVIVPPAPPNPGPRPGRDPVLIELGNIEAPKDGKFRIQFISLGDDAATSFDAKDAIFELPVVGYDVANRRATIALNADQMKEKGIVAGEELVLRQVDAQDNASDGIYVRLDAAGWANQNLNEPLGDGNFQNVRGAAIDILTGVAGLPGAAEQGKMERILGKATRDVTAPKLLRDNVTASSVTFSKEELKKIDGLVDACLNQFGWINITPEYLNQLGDQTNWTAPAREAAKAFAADKALFEKLDAALNGTKAGQFNGQLLHFVKEGGDRITRISFDKALPPGSQISVQNSRTGEVKALNLSEPNGQVLTDAHRKGSVIFTKAADGDPMVVTYRDGAGNSGNPYGFVLASCTKDGKAKADPLGFRISTLTLKPKPAQS
ncbi:MAG: hypothetical protein HY791_05270 [Deltaproteobacteria bacterium]|nr:hypothetical protein [Deltaproteobacteria bacterium]